jgi:ribosomal protein S18 acetylase RimI-like enzyme
MRQDRQTTQLKKQLQLPSGFKSEKILLFLQGIRTARIPFEFVCILFMFPVHTGNMHACFAYSSFGLFRGIVRHRVKGKDEEDLKKLERKDFNRFYTLLENSFPKDEYKSYEGQKKLFEDPKYDVLASYDQEDNLQGCAAVWKIQNGLFLEHLAVDPKYRNQGLGGKILNALEERCDRICLEVDPPETSIAKRRIGFYERHGFVLNHYPYMMPSLEEGKEALPLLVMTYPEPVRKEDFPVLKKIIYQNVYKFSEES